MAAGNFGNTRGIAVAYGANVTLAENNATPFTAGINLTGPGTVTKAGPGTLTNQGSLSVGGVTVAQGTYNVAAAANVTGSRQHRQRGYAGICCRSGAHGPVLRPEFPRF